MVTSPLYIKEVNNEDWLVAYLYEHLIVYRLRQKMEKAGFPSDLVGVISGETFDETVIFLDTYFYNQQAGHYFLELMKETEPSFTGDEINFAVGEIECEERATLRYDEQKLRSALNRLRALPWTRITDYNYRDYRDHHPKTNKLIQLEPNQDNYQGVRVDLILPRSAYGEASKNLIVFTRLSVMLIDAINRAISQTGPCSVNENYEVAERFARFSRTRTELILPSDRPLDGLPQICNDALTSRIRNPKHFTYIKEHLVGWAQDERMQLWVGIDYFRYRDVIVGGRGMEELVTPDRISKIMDNLRLKISPIL